MRPSDYERQPAPEFLFERRPLRRWPPVAPQPGEAILVAGNQPAHRATRHEERTIPRGDAPKRGGIRVIYYLRSRQGEIWMLTLYAKNEVESIPGHVLKKIKEEIDGGA